VVTPAALADTSLFVGIEAGRPIHYDRLPAEIHVSVVTLAELEAGVLRAPDAERRARRLATLREVASLEAEPITEAAAHHWALLRSRLAEAGLRANVNDLWIAACALALGLPVVTQDADFEALEPLGGPKVILI
jgi:predicted nucleic acid-binding protein